MPPLLARLVRVACVVLGALAAGTAPASGTTFTVNPTRVSLSPGAKSALLSLQNTSRETVRFQIDAFQWDQDARGQLVLTPTSEIIFFPKLVSLRSGEQRNIRVGTSLAPGPVERTFRIFIEELPPAPDVTGAPPQPGEVRVLTRVGIPIFVAARQPRRETRLEGLMLQGGQFTFVVRNNGNVHAVPAAIRVVGYAGSEVALERELQTWYILAGGRREYDVTIPLDACRALTAIVVEVELDHDTLRERFDARSGRCE